CLRPVSTLFSKLFSMTIFNFYLFNRDGCCISYKEWKREKQAGMSKDEEFKLMHGMLISLRSFASKLSTKNGQQQVKSYETSQYKMNYLETPTGLKMVLNTDPGATGIPELMRLIYQVYVDTVVKNPLVDCSAEITSELFQSRLNELVEKHHSF
uniref:Trafficking protein particle complex subunit n=1 Tax=Parascaris univalens TaxID=6257 RepID=A0A914ZDK6_PARUN